MWKIVYNERQDRFAIAEYCGRTTLLLRQIIYLFGDRDRYFIRGKYLNIKTWTTICSY